LIRYCVILLPLNKFRPTPLLTVSTLSVLLFIYSDLHITSPLSYGLMYRASALLLVALMLFIVMISVVRIVERTSGTLKFYVQNPLHGLRSNFVGLHYHRNPQFYKMSTEKVFGLLSSQTIWFHSHH